MHYILFLFKVSFAHYSIELIMDHLVGDDIAMGIRQVVRQLLNLASDPDSQVLMARQSGIFRTE